MGYSIHTGAFAEDEPAGIRLTALPLFCEACRYTFYLVIPGTLTRVNGVFHIAERNCAPAIWHKPVCPECGSGALWLWSLL